jgi:hypothetical protein
MKTMRNPALSFLLIVLASATCLAQTSAFTYQGKLAEAGLPANGVYQFEFKLFDTDSGGNQVGSTQTVIATVQGGTFTTQLDFGAAAFPADADRWLEIGVRPNASGSPYTTLSPRQQLSSVPFAVRSRQATSADNATNATTADSAITAGNVTGVVAVANGGTGSSTQNFVDLSGDQRRIAGDKEFLGTVSVAGASGRFVGDGSGLTNVNASVADGSITTPKLADGSVTQAKLAFVVGGNRYDPQLVAMLRWDLLPVVPNSVAVGRDPSALAFDGIFIYVANKLDNNVNRIRAATGVIEGNPIAVGAAPAALAYDGTFVYVANSGSNSITKIRASSGAVEGSPIGVGTTPVALAFDGTFLYAANFGSSSVTRIRVSTGVVEGTPITVGFRPAALVFTGGFVYVSHELDDNTGLTAGIWKINTSTGLVEGTAVPQLRNAMAFDGTFVYVAGAAVSRIRATTGTLVNPPIATSVAGVPTLVCFDGTTLYAVEPRETLAGSTVFRLNTSALGMEGSFSVSGVSTALVFDGTYIYIANKQKFTDPNTGMNSPVNGNVVRFPAN